MSEAPRTTADTSTAGFFFMEKVTEDFETHATLTAISFTAQSKFQEVKVIETVPFGQTLILDGKTQSAARDEYIYHESLVHPAMTLHGAAKRVFIGGGGEGATAREVLRHASVEKLVMVDIDEVVVKVSAEQLPQWSAGAFDDPRMQLVVDDAYAWLTSFDATRDEDKFDVIIMDIADPIEAGPGIVLYTQEFYRQAITKLAPGGILVTQAGPAGMLTVHECFPVIHNTLNSVFDCVAGYSVEIPSFGSPWGFTLAFNSLPEASASGCKSADDVRDLATQTVDAQIAKTLGAESPLRFYDGVGHRHAFNLPRWARDLVSAEQRVMTKENPVFMY